MELFHPLSYSTPKAKIMHSAAIILFVSLFFIPYQEIRTERIRAFGENKAVGIVIDKTIRKEEGDSAGNYVMLHLLTYSFIDPLGLPRDRTASVDTTFWENITKGDSVLVHYAKAEPGISRIQNEKESAVVQMLARFSRSDAP